MRQANSYLLQKKRASVFPTSGLVSLWLQKEPRCELAVAFDLGLPQVFQLRVELATVPDDCSSSDLKELYLEMADALLEQISAYFVVAGYASEQIAEVVVSCRNALVELIAKPLSEVDKYDLLSPSLMLEKGFKLPELFTAMAQHRTVTAAYYKQDLPKMKPLPKKSPMSDARKSITQFRDKILRSHPSRVYTVVYNIHGTPVGVVEVGKKRIK